MTHHIFETFLPRLKHLFTDYLFFFSLFFFHFPPSEVSPAGRGSPRAHGAPPPLPPRVSAQRNKTGFKLRGGQIFSPFLFLHVGRLHAKKSPLPQTFQNDLLYFSFLFLRIFYIILKKRKSVEFGTILS